MRIGFVMPAYNEEQLLAETVDGVARTIDRLVIVNDGSKDATADVAERLRREWPWVIVVHHPYNRGVGAAVVTGIRTLLEYRDIDAIGIIGADNQCDPSLIPLFRRILTDCPEISVAKGSRFLHRETLHSMPRFRYWGNRGVSMTMQVILGYWGMSDVLHGYLLARRDVFRVMDLDQIAEGYDLENTMMTEFRRLRCAFALVPSPSRYGREASKIVYWKQIPKTLRKMAVLLARRLTTGAPFDRLSPALLLTTTALAVLALLQARPSLAGAAAGSLALALVAMRVSSPMVRIVDIPTEDR